MSTICKIDRSVRLMRTERKLAIRQWAARANPNTRIGYIFMGATRTMERLRRNPAHNGDTKHARYIVIRRMLGQAQMQNLPERA